MQAHIVTKRPILIAGSTYTEDEKVLFPAYQRLRENIPDTFPHLILVPHEPTPERISEIRDALDRQQLAYLCFSELTSEVDLSEVEVLIVDRVGLLAKLYGLADIAFVGGSFRGSVHNVMEPAAMAKPVLFGPTIQNAYEASLLVARGGAKLVHTSQQLAEAITRVAERYRREGDGRQYWETIDCGKSGRGGADFGVFTGVCVKIEKSRTT